MIAKALELRDENTFIPVLCVDMNPEGGVFEAVFGEGVIFERSVRSDAQRYLLRRCGYACDGRPNIIMTRLNGSGQATNDPYAWGGRTYPIAHDYIIKHWAELADGDVVDVQWILGETEAPKRSERESVP